MPALRLKLFNDITNEKLVTGLVLPASFILPEIGDQDNIAIELQLLELLPGGGPQAPLSIVSPVGVSPTVAIGAANASSIYAQQTSWVIAGDLLTGTLNLNTAEMAAGLGSATRLDCLFAIVLEDATGRRLSFQGPVVIKKSLIRIGSPSPIPGVTYATMDMLNNTFLKKINDPGVTVTFIDSTSAYGRILGVNSDGSAQDDSYTI